MNIQLRNQLGLCNLYSKLAIRYMVDIMLTRRTLRYMVDIMLTRRALILFV